MFVDSFVGIVFLIGTNKKSYEVATDRIKVIECVVFLSMEKMSNLCLLERHKSKRIKYFKAISKEINTKFFFKLHSRTPHRILWYLSFMLFKLQAIIIHGC